MPGPLLTTKLYIPPPRSNLVLRPRLLEQLDGGLREGKRLTLVSAPPGFGKTTLVAEWVSRSRRDVAWISLDESDNDPVQFLNYLIAALQQVDGRIGRTVQSMLGSPELGQGILAAVVNEITAADTPLCLVLDDLQLITSTAVLQIIEFLVEHQPPQMHTILSTRHAPALPLHKWRARGQLAEMGERDLRFRVDEATAFLNQTMGLDLPVAAVAALEARTEGWIAGLQLAALALQETPGDAEAFVATFAGDDRYVADYLVTEVLHRQPEPLREFLLQTAVLERLSAPLCTALTGRDDSQAVLERLARANLFLIPLDHRQEWYRYHRLFAEVLRSGLSEQEKASLHRNAARWYETAGMLRQAIPHALALAPITGDWETAQHLIRLVAEEMLVAGSMLTLRGWFDALPDETVRADGELATYLGWVLALTSELVQAEDYAQTAEEALRGQTGAPEWGKLLALRSFLAVFGHQRYQEAIEQAAGALQMLGPEQAHWRVIALWSMAESQERTTDITQAIGTLREARRTGRRLGNQVFAATVELFLATDLQHHGQRREAVAVCEEAMAHYADGLGRPLPVTGLISSRLAMLHYEANQLELARQYVEQGLALSHQLTLEGPLMYAYGFAAPILHAQGETAAALANLRTAYEIATRTELAESSWILALEANIHLQLGEFATAARWAEEAGLSPDQEPGFLHMNQHLAFARLLLVQGRLADARRWLGRLETLTRGRKLYRWLLTVYLLGALLAQRSGNEVTARARLVQALEIAVPGDYYRAFLEEDRGLLELLSAQRHLAPGFVDQLLDFAGLGESQGEITTRVAAIQPLVEPLTSRELEVLRLIATGLSNREIAQRLVIATGTVKRHIHNLYGKLGVSSRTQATARARDLGLL
jgi:LuxR family maltose regulon positive regulatory protein